MKKILFIKVVFIFLFVNIKSQELDLGTLKVTYNLNYVNDTSNILKISNDLMILIIGKKVSTFYSNKQFIADSILNVDEQKGVSQADMLANLRKYKGSRNKYTIFKNYPNNKITTFEKVGHDQFQYEEPLESPVWKITNEKVKILSYTCQKATAFYLGRNYEAWFTTEISINNGPWKFNGLPGLILRVYDTRHHFNFECIGLELLKPGKQIILPKGSFILVSKQEFQKIYKRVMTDPIGYLQSSSGVEIKMNNANNNFIKPFNPIEL